ncbi:flagella cluster protein [Haloplanus sp. GCM10025708]|uniref:DUF7385 family protein n=1 Tax=Haloferacaceae TaxID=1644056 RepID=UPI003620861D
METLDVSDGFDVHEYRHGLKLHRQDGESMYLVNRADFACPACERPFDRLFVSSAREVTFANPPDAPFCLVRTPDRLLLLTH